MLVITRSFPPHCRQVSMSMAKTEPLQYGNPCVHDESTATRIGQRFDKTIQERLAVLIIDADARLDNYRNLDRRLHRRKTLGDQLRPLHQTGAELAALNTIAGTAYVDIDFIVAAIGCCQRRSGHHYRFTAAQLDDDRVFARVERQQSIGITVPNRCCSHHLGVQLGIRRQEPKEVPAMPVCPIHHRGDGHRREIAGFVHRLCQTEPGPAHRSA